ncbi:glycosyltransferase family 9 protein [Erwinia persicina]|uniref:glycosyltransferase family 9 protein n=1 Tax=Erwinia persicina TaxID=55211 RepID=UPI001786CFAA|nr:glycosyltransferase family 9 protein [Erwinia persicina]MBD8161560.1 glycosyltransferase family 9 protein [Erwinia persicina]
MSLLSGLRHFAYSFYDYPAAAINTDTVSLAVIHIPDQIGDAMSIFPLIRSLEYHRIDRLIIVASRLNRPVFDALTLRHTTLTVISMPCQDEATYQDIKAVAGKIRKEYGVPDLCIEAMRKKNFKTMLFISRLRAKTNLQAVGLTMKCYSPLCQIASRMDQVFRAPVPMTWSVLMREAGFPSVRPAFEFPLSAHVLDEVSQETQQFDPYIALNLDGSVAERTFSLATAIKLIARITGETKMPVVIVHGPDGCDKATVLTRLYNRVHRISLPPSIARSAAVIKNATFAITPDTSVLHMASAYNIPAIAVYANYKTRWPAMQDISEAIVVGSQIDNIDLDEFRSVLRRLLARAGQRFTPEHQDTVTLPLPHAR